jgi:FkbM family methyltransferase
MGNPTWNDVMKFELKKDSVIFDVGGYMGDFAQICIDRYENPKIYIFEPVLSFYEKIVQRYKNNENIKVYNFGLSDITRDEYISTNGDASSIYSQNDKTEKIKLKSIKEFLFEEQIFQVDLIKINIEGEEYRLLEYLSSIPELNVFENYLVQFHGFVDGYVEKRNSILEKVSVYYDTIFNYEFIFEGWTQKKIQKINCFGDSHISIFSNKESLFNMNELIIYDSYHTYRFGPYLAYNLINKPNVYEIINNVSYDENILICFGEIDCRAQVKKNMDEQNKDYIELIDEIIDRYFQFIDTLYNKNIILFSVTPELKEEPFMFYYREKPEAFDKPRGTYSERRKFKEYFNQKVKEECSKKGYKFLSIYDYLVDGDTTKEIYYVDDIHLKPKNVLYLINREMIKNNLIESPFK